MEKKDIMAKLNHLKIAPRKVMLVVDLIRRKTVREALAILDLANKKPAAPIKKLLNSAVANAKNNFHLNEENLYVSKVVVNQGPKLRRWIARARGQSNEIQKKTSHVVLVLSEKEESEDKKFTPRKENEKALPQKVKKTDSKITKKELKNKDKSNK